MPPFEAYSHYLAYGATDQETLRELREMYTGVLVPATIAAWQRQGTGGFVLSLSATAEAPPYLIDPRFPLFQQALAVPKASHHALASDVFGDAGLIRRDNPLPDQFPEERLAHLASRWVAFNRDYGATSNESFDKYARRLGEGALVGHVQAPEGILPPYFACDSADDSWWEKSKRLFALVSEESNESPCFRVICARRSQNLDVLLRDVGEEQLVVWVSGLNEYEVSAEELVSYKRAIEGATGRGQEAFGLYGGFFSVLMGSAGLRGASHGVGFSEHRSWRELPVSGAAPARYYLRRAHRYVAQDLAQALYQTDPELAHCPCVYCGGREPVTLTYHDLMKHSVWCRNEEISDWYGADLLAAADSLQREHASLRASILGGRLPPGIVRRALTALEHLPVWVAALRA